MQIIARKAAIDQKLTRFFTNIPCKVGHVSERLTSSGECVSCKQGREQKSKKVLEYKKQRYQLNRDHFLNKQKEYSEQNKDQISLYQAQWRINNKLHIKEYREANLALYAAHRALRRARLKQAMPPWGEEEQIKELYQHAQQLTLNTGEIYEVHHIVPLQGFKHVRGLHCLSNLVIVTEKEHKKLHSISNFDEMVNMGVWLLGQQKQ